MLWRPNTLYISSRHVQYINRSQLLITDLQPAEDDTRRRLCSAMLMTLSASSPLAFHPSLPACHLTPFPVITPSVTPSTLVVHLFLSFACRSLPLSFPSIFLAFLPCATWVRAQRRDSAPTMGLFTRTWFLQARRIKGMCILDAL